MVAARTPSLKSLHCWTRRCEPTACDHAVQPENACHRFRADQWGWNAISHSSVLVLAAGSCRRTRDQSDEESPDAIERPLNSRGRPKRWHIVIHGKAILMLCRHRRLRSVRSHSEEASQLATLFQTIGNGARAWHLPGKLHRLRIDFAGCNLSNLLVPTGPS